MDSDFNVRHRPAKLAAIPVRKEVSFIDRSTPLEGGKNNTYHRSNPAAQDARRFSIKKYGPELGPYMDDIDDAADEAMAPPQPKEHALFRKGKVASEAGAIAIDETGDVNGDNTKGSSSMKSDNAGDNDPWYKRWIAFVKAHPQSSIAVGAAIVLLLAGGVTFALTRPNKVTNNQITAKKYVKPKPAPPAPITSPMTGLVVSADEAKRPTTGVMVENTVFARPQSGLKEAGVVYEAIAEAGITRFLALYQESKPANIGPVRSSRPYYVDWAHSFDAAYGHVGGSPDALDKIKADGVKDLDQFFNSSYYHRVSSRDAPHNVYTSMDQLDTAKSQKGWTTSSFTSWPRKADAPAKGAAITAQRVDIAISGPTYDTHYDYNPDTNTYNRSEGGAPHIDAESKTQLSPKVVIGMVIPYSLEADGYHSKYVLDGTGNMVVFQDGIATNGTWQRGTGNAQYVFSDESGHPLKLDAGQTWITAVSNASAITYAATK